VRKALLLLVVCCLSTSLLAGCWNRRELETLGFITSVGLDQAVETDKIQLTAHITKPFAMVGTSASAAVDEKPYWTEISTGYTTFEAVRNLLSKTTRRPNWSHNRVIIFGEELARQGIRDSLDVFDRDGETRRLTNIFVVKGRRASEMLEAQYGMERLPEEGCCGIMLVAEAGLSTVVPTNLNEFAIMLETPGLEPTAARTELIPLVADAEQRAQEDVRSNVKRDTLAMTVRITGAAAFKGDRLVGWLNKPETRGLNWVKGDVRSGIIVVMAPEEGAKYIGLEILRAGSKITPQVKDGRPSVKVEIEAQANLGDVRGSLTIPNNQGLWAELERRMATVIRHEVQAALAKAQKEFNSDIFGFGAAFYRDLPREWQKLAADWDEEFPRLPVEIVVETTLFQPGRIMRTIRNE